ncbi:MEMO1-like protein [Elsinoe fawcettii]|nr:MEMO1-like protein [Elsinoe fawcettii]
MSIREASHAGSWYTSSGSQLSSQLDGWLNEVKTPVKGIGASSGTSVSENALPVPGARIIIAPHAGYSYSGPAAAWAYKSWNVSRAKRVFLLGPSHHFYLTNAALSKCAQYATPLGNLAVDRTTTEQLHKSGAFSYMSKDVDEDEHSLEMHLPYIYKMLSLSFSNPSSFPPLVPIMVGNTSAGTERSLGKVLAPYLADPENAFVVSSDFAHWGARFRYTYYVDGNGEARSLKSSEKEPKEPAIHDSIQQVDFECIDACETGKHQAWLDVLGETGNTVCGRHPIGVVMAGIEEIVGKDGVKGDGKFRFVRYERSSLVKRIADSSVSYASAYAVL